MIDDEEYITHYNREGKSKGLQCKLDESIWKKNKCDIDVFISNNKNYRKKFSDNFEEYIYEYIRNNGNNLNCKETNTPWGLDKCKYSYYKRNYGDLRTKYKDKFWEYVDHYESVGKNEKRVCDKNIYIDQFQNLQLYKKEPKFLDNKIISMTKHHAEIPDSKKINELQLNFGFNLILKKENKKIHHLCLFQNNMSSLKMIILEQKDLSGSQEIYIKKLLRQSIDKNEYLENNYKLINNLRKNQWINTKTTLQLNKKDLRIITFKEDDVQKKKKKEIKELNEKMNNSKDINIIKKLRGRLNILKNDYLVAYKKSKKKKENKIITFENNNHKTYFNDSKYIGSYLSKDFYKGSIIHLFQNKYIVENKENKQMIDEIFNEKKMNIGHVIKHEKMNKIYITEKLKPPQNFLSMFLNVKHLILYEMSNDYIYEKQWLLHNKINSTSGFGFGFNLNFNLLKTCRVMNDLYSRGFLPPPGKAGLIMKIGWPKVKDMFRKKV